MSLAECLGTEEEKRLLTDAGLAASRLLPLRAWAAATPESRRVMVIQVYELICQLYGLKHVSLAFDSLWRNAAGKFDPDTGQIVLSDELLGRADPSDTIKTLAHEGRHAFQVAALDGEVAVSLDILATWREAEERYPRRADFASFSEFLDAYQRNAMEIDAWEAELSLYAGYESRYSSS